MKKTNVSINGTDYTVRYTLLRKSRGSCDHPGIKNPEILIDKRLKGVEELEVSIHEMLHALAFKMFDEEWVFDSAIDLAKALYELGWRKGEENGECACDR
tara:strand:+ start:1153 stop:1452 length:300 start_codon:yes stop_codon:yes gene_type:complete